MEPTRTTNEPLLFDARLKEDRDFWLATLRRGAEPAGLPLDRKRSKVYSLKKDTVEIPLSADAVRELDRLTGGSPFLLTTALLVALGVCLHRWTGHRILVVGSPTTVEAGLPGPEANVLPLVVEVPAGASFRDLLLATRERLMAAHDHQEYAFERLVQDLGISGEESRCPLFDLAFAIEGFHRPLPALRNDATVLFHREGDALRGRVELNARVLQRDTVERFASHFSHLLAGALADTSRPVDWLPILGPDEERRVLVEWNRAPEVTGDAARGVCVHQLFEAQAEKTPDTVAATFGERQLTYAELDRLGNQLAHRLRRLGVGPDARVGICLERSLEMLTGVLAILKAGGAYLPLDPSYPAERLAFLLADARVSVLLTQSSLLSKLSGQGATVLCLEEDGPALAEESGDRPDSGATPDSLAYVIYTSGSTGQPKGVAMPHRPLANLIAWQATASLLPAGGRSLQLTSLGFDVSFQEMFATWAVGGSLVIAGEDVRRDLVGLPRFLTDERIERLFVPFVALQQLAEVGSSLGELPATLREVVTAGEQLQITPAVMRFFRQLEGCALENQYGPSETHVVSAFRLQGFPNHWPALPPIGRPIAGARLHVLDASLQPVPAGAPGELHVGGVALARGYLDRPDATAERFVPDPFAVLTGDEPGNRLYRTGDLARHLPDGTLEFLGRMDHQVKIRGYRVEPGEIEVALAAHPGVREAAVVAREDEPGQRRLVAYIVAAGEAPEVRDLRAFLRDRLPEFMVPTSFVELPSLPLTPSGKVDRRSLPAPEKGRRAAGTYIAPQGEVEESLAAIWVEVLGMERVGGHDDFFDLGGHSLLGAQVLARVNERHGTELTLRHLFETPTVAGLARLIETLRSGTAPSVSPQAPALVARRDELLNELSADLDGLSEDEVRALLEAEAGSEA